MKSVMWIRQDAENEALRAQVSALELLLEDRGDKL